LLGERPTLPSAFPACNGTAGQGGDWEAAASHPDESDLLLSLRSCFTFIDYTRASVSAWSVDMPIVNLMTESGVVMPLNVPGSAASPPAATVAARPHAEGGSPAPAVAPPPASGDAFDFSAASFHPDNIPAAHSPASFAAPGDAGIFQFPTSAPLGGSGEADAHWAGLSSSGSAATQSQWDPALVAGIHQVLSSIPGALMESWWTWLDAKLDLRGAEGDFFVL
jgi:hypothetical protein